MAKKKSAPEPEVTFEVENIYKARVTRKSWEYFIKWGGYPDEENSWEPERHLTGCSRLLSSFWKQFGPEVRLSAGALPQGHTITPTKTWIERHREIYQKSSKRKEAQRQKVKNGATGNNDNVKNDSDMEESEEEVAEEVVGATHVEGNVVATKISPDEAPTVADIEPSDSEYSDPDDIPLSLLAQNRPLEVVQSDGSRSESSHTDEDSALRKRKRTIANDREVLSHEPQAKRQRSKLSSSSLVVVEDSATVKNDVSSNFHASDDYMPNIMEEGRDQPHLISPDVPSSPAGSLFDESDGDAPVALSAKTCPWSEASKVEPTLPLSRSPTVNPTHSESPQPQPVPLSVRIRPTVSIDTAVAPTVKSIPAHVQRKLNPKVRMMPIPLPSAAGSTQGIYTKARIASRKGYENLASPISPLVTPNIAIPHSPAIDAEKWLKENVSISNGNMESVEAQSPTISSAQPGALHFNKRWRWAGQLAVGDNESDNGFAEPVGEIVLSDSTHLDRSVSELGIHLLLPSSMESLCFRQCYPLSAFPAAIADFQISQFARIIPNKAIQTSSNIDQEGAFDALVTFMVKNELFTVSELHFSDRQVATMFVFPSSLEYLWDQINVPRVFRRQDGLVVAVAFQVYKPVSDSSGLIEPFTSDWKHDTSFDSTSEIVAQAADSGRALMTLRFPDSLYKRIAQKTYAIFTLSAEDALPDSDTLALKAVLTSIPGCKPYSIIEGGATRCIFIHVSSWSTLHKLPGIVHRRLRRPEVLFFTYGSDPIVDPSFWGLQEVFPIGGIVTFTPRAIAENPIGVEKLIMQLAKHPLWTCYVLPSTIAMIVNLINGDSNTDPDPKLKSIIVALSTILTPIERGLISLTWHPPPVRCWCHDQLLDNVKSRFEEWRIEQACLSDLKGYDLVTECQRILRESQDRTEKDVENTIVKDLVIMQSLFRRDYRRFVVITDSTGPCNTSKEAAAGYSTRTADIRDMFEFTHVDDFNFNDDYFKVDTSVNHEA